MFKRSSLAGLLVGLVAQAALPSPAAADGIAWIRALDLTPGAPLIMLPPTAGAMIAVDEQDKESSLSQTITLAGDPGVKGENTVVVQVTRDGLAPRIDDSDVAAEVQRVLPDLALSLGPSDLRNAFGLFGAVVGRNGAMACLYAWQRVNLADVWITGHAANPFEKPVAMTIRYRLCRTGLDTTQLIAAVEGAQSGAFPAEGAPLVRSLGGDPLAAAASVSAPGTLPDPTPFLASMAPPPPRAARPRRHVRTVRARRNAAPAMDASPMSAPLVANAPAVPLP